MAPALEVRDVHKRFSLPSEQRHTVREHVFGLLRRRTFETLHVLRGVSFHLERGGETLGIMGGNGAGKSTLLKIVTGIYQPDEGAVVRHAPITSILELGAGWNPELDAVDNVLLVSTIMGVSLRGARASVDAILAFAELERFANLQLKHYSSGMAARLAYAIAFLSVREVLILDEVFAVGDAAFKARCEARFRELIAAGHSAILVSHNPAQIAGFCDRAVLLDGGRVAFEGDGRAVAAEYERRMGIAGSSS